MNKFKTPSPSKDWTDHPHENERLAQASRPGGGNPTHRKVRDECGTRLGHPLYLVFRGGKYFFSIEATTM